MGFFSSFNPFHAVTRALGVPDKAAQIVSNVLPLTALAGAKPYGVDLYGSAGKLLTPAHRPSPQIVHGGQGLPGGPTPSYNITYGAPSYGSSGGYAPSYQPAGAFYGGSPWDYSTTFSQPSTPQYQTYSAAVPQQADRTWEDLITAAVPLFL